MANNIVPISQLPAATQVALTDVVPIVNSGITKKATLAQILEEASSDSACYLATTTNLNATYVNGAFGIGATLTNAGTLVALTIDGIAATVGMRVLVKNQTTDLQNGIYIVTAIGSGSVAWVLTRAADYNVVGDIDPGDFFTVAFGTVNSKTQWIQTSVVEEVGISDITFESNIVAGSGVTKTNNIISASSGGVSYVEVTSTSQSMAQNTGYVTNNASLITLTLPVTAVFGSEIIIVGKGIGGWTIAQNSGQSLQIGSVTSTAGIGGSVSSTNRYDSIRLVCTTANTVFTTAGGVQGNVTVV